MIDIKKKYKTRDGRDVELKFTDGKGEYPVAGYIIDENNYAELHEWRSNGKYVAVCGEDDHDLIEVKESKVLKCWVNFYEDDTTSGPHDTKEEADEQAGYNLENYYRERIGEAVEVTKEVEE